jgi:hypothetical protein
MKDPLTLAEGTMIVPSGKRVLLAEMEPFAQKTLPPCL